MRDCVGCVVCFFFQAEDGIRDVAVTGVQTCALPILWVFGSQLSYRWIREMPNPLLSWFLHACYLAYYAILYASPLGLWFSGRRDAARRRLFARVATI